MAMAKGLAGLIGGACARRHVQAWGQDQHRCCGEWRVVTLASRAAFKLSWQSFSDALSSKHAACELRAERMADFG